MKYAEKGSYGYTDAHKRRQIRKTVLFFLLPIAIFLTGYFTTGSRENYFTIVAVVGSLPACKELVNVVMFAKRRSMPKALYEEIASHTEGLEAAYELVLTTYETTYSLPALVIAGNTVAGYTLQREMQTGRAQAHIQKALEQNGFPKAEVQIFRDLKEFLDRADALAAEKTQTQEMNAQEADMRRVILALSI